MKFTSLCSRRFLGKTSGVLAALALAAVSSAHAATSTWDNPSSTGAWVSGDWTTAGNWNPAAAPVSDPATDLVFNLALHANTGWLKTGTGINGGSFTLDSVTLGGTTTMREDFYIYAGNLSGGTGVANRTTTLDLGAGGVTVTGLVASGQGDVLNFGDENLLTNKVNLNLTANQTWNITRNTSNGEGRSGSVRLGSSDLSGSGNLLKTGNGNLYFAGGASTSYTGSVTLREGGILLNAVSQLGRLGTNALNWENGAATTYLTLAGGVGANYSQNIQFSDTGAAGYSLNSGNTGSNFSVNVSGVMTGALNEVLNIVGDSNKSLFLWKISGNNSGLSSSKTGGFVNGGTGAGGLTGVFMRTGHVSLENANALGTGNSLTVGIGQHNSSGLGSVAGLYATSGNNVASNIWLSLNNATSAKTNDVILGLQGAGAVTFSGNIGLASTSNTNYALNNLHLTADMGSQVEFSGQFFDQVSTDTRKAAVIVEGGGTVILSNANNIYGGTATTSGGGTSVIGGTTLLVNGGGVGTSGTGTGNVLVGYAASASTSVTTTSGSGIVTVGSTAGLVIGQTVSGTGIAAGSVIERINADNTVQLNKVATATGTPTDFSGAAATGNLGGTGTIRPGSANGVIVASGSSVMPGDIGSVGTLIFDGGATSGTLATFQTGATFIMDLNATSVTSDTLQLLNGATGDFVFSNNVITFNLTGTMLEAQQFTLFDGTADNQFSGLVVDGFNKITAGLSFTGLTGDFQTNSYLSLVSGDIILTTVPEPSALALFGLGLAGLAFLRRSRRSRVSVG